MKVLACDITGEVIRYDTETVELKASLAVLDSLGGAAYVQTLPLRDVRATQL